MQNKLTHGPLLDMAGNLVEAGYSTELIREYRRDQIKANSLRIKEWDYYYVGNKRFGIALTIADNSYMSMVSVSFLDFIKKEDETQSVIKFFSKGKLNLPSTSKEGDLKVTYKNVEIAFLHEKDRRHLTLLYKAFKDEKDLRADIYLTETNEDSMVIATPFMKKRHFYYNQKINLLAANGYVKYGDDYFDFTPDSYGVLDWGRGVWTYKNTWYWASMNGETSKKEKIGFNLGYGFGDTSKASENMFFYNNSSFKLNDVRFNIPIDSKGKYDYLSPWSMVSESGDINITFNPVLNRKANMNFVILASIQNQVFGTYSGYVIVEGKKISFEDVPGFAERVFNKW